MTLEQVLDDLERTGHFFRVTFYNRKGEIITRAGRFGVKGKKGGELKWDPCSKGARLFYIPGTGHRTFYLDSVLNISSGSIRYNMESV